jgi:hypothetical protein
MEGRKAMNEHGIERGAAEEGADAPVTPTEVEASRRPPSEGAGSHDEDDSDEKE